ncbi:Down syndrome critical region protein 3, partial [Halocaridina rubra]
MLSGAAEVLQPGIETEQAPNPSSSSTVLDSKPAWGGASISTNTTWGSPSPDSPEKSGSCSFRDLMSEDLAKHMQDKENELYIRAMIQGGADSSNLLDFKKSEDTSDDFLLAQMLQYEFDREHDQQLKREERHYNGNSKVSVSFNKYKICPTWYGPDSDDDFEEVDEENRDIDSFEARERDDPLLSSRGYTKVGKQFVTKHDLMISGRKNAERIMNLPPGINTGDGGGFDMQLSNKVYNNLQHSAKSEIRRKNRIHDKVEKATSDMALDQNTRLLIFKWVNNVILESVNGIISAGKEAVVFHALGG